MEHYPSITELKEALGSDYQIREIDWETCLYRDFGNGFNVEISGVSHANRRKLATAYLWYGDDLCNCLIVKIARDVGRSADAIASVVDSLYDYSKELIANGYSNGDSLYKLVNEKGRN